jgi:phosphatidylserine decarboxylase
VFRNPVSGGLSSSPAHDHPVHDPLSVTDACRSPPAGGPGSGATQAVGVGERHPPELSRCDRRYLVPWGRRLIAVGVLTAACAIAFATWGAVAHSPWWALVLAPVAAGLAFDVLFFRNPRRSVPAAAGILVSPADGTVWDVEELEEPEWVGARCLRIGIFLSVFDVHVNRAPCDARVAYQRHRPGRFLDARRPEAGRENESNALGLIVEEEGPARGARLLVRQVSGAIARRIVCPLAVSDAVVRGGLIGMIKFGSRTELWVPVESGFAAAVRVGDKVRGGESVLGHFPGAARGGAGAARTREAGGMGGGR